jgi:hypothetical protein
MDAKENALIAISRIPASSGHSLHKGTPREAFIKEFLESHLPSSVSIGTGEIIDSNSKPGEQRNQFDIVIYKKNFPKLDFGGGISGFLIESVIATIEVKSTLDEEGLKQAILAANNIKKLSKSTIKSFHTGYIPPSVLSFVIAYDGPVNMSTVYKWIPKVHNENGIDINDLPLDDNERINIPSPTIDAVFILKKGFVYFDNLPIGFANDEYRRKNPQMKWILSDTNSGNLLFFFLLIHQAMSNLEGEWLNSIPYLSSFKLEKILFGK